jgi:hypothetical protein
LAAGSLEPSLIVHRVPDSQVAGFGIIDRNVEDIGARRVKKSVAHHRAYGTRYDHRFGDKAVDRSEGLRLINAGARDDRQCGLKGKMTDENGEPAQYDALRFAIP